MITIALSELFERDLQKLKTEMELYKNEDNLWVLKKGISNTAGNLCLHLVGNLNHFIGATLGKSGYVRYRDDEFSLKNIPRQDLVINIDNCILKKKNTFSKLSGDISFAGRLISPSFIAFSIEDAIAVFIREYSSGPL